MENKKKIIIVVSILLIYFVVMMVFFGMDSLKKKIYHLEILIAPDTYIKYERGKWKDVTKDEVKMLNQTYQIYDGSKYLFEGTLQYTEERWYAFDKNRKPLSLPERFFAYRGNMEVSILNYKTQEMSESELTEAEKILKERNITFKPSYTKSYKIEADFNNDGINETIYVISNTLGMDEQSIYFSISYMKTNGKIEVLVDDVSEDMYQIPSLSVKEIIDIKNDKKYELIFEKIYFNNIGTCHEVFEYEKESYSSVKACELIERGDEDE